MRGTTGLRLSRALTGCLLALLALGGCSRSDDGTGRSADPAFTGDSVFLAACNDGRDCQSGLCLGLDTGGGVCTHTCKRAAECPRAENWGCSDTAESETSVCVCVADGPEEVCGDGRDNDCDGAVDDCLVCGARLVPPNDRLNCGGCGNVCPAGALCEAGACVCQAGAECAGEAGAACRRDGDCDDHVACTADACSEGRCHSRLDATACGEGTSCDPRAALCVAGPVCANDEDCADDDACTVHERCDAASRRCVYETLDGDGDGHAPAVCGGDDCDDSDREVLPGGVEQCDQRDNDCDGLKDDGLLGEPCGEGRVCGLAGCECGPGHRACGDACVDPRTDGAHCGACDNACTGGASCQRGLCDCAPGTLLCHGECRAPDAFEADARNCGACGAVCGANEVCEGGSCVCGSDATLCAGACIARSAFASSEEHCGGCGNLCDAAETCEDGACVCSGARSHCGGACVDTSSDAQHCGACGVVCEHGCLDGGCATPASIVTSFASSCVLYQDGRARCSGRMTGRTPLTLRDERGEPLFGIVQLVINDSAAAPYVCARRADGTLLCGGDPLLRTPSMPARLSPVYAEGMSELAGVVDVKLGSDASCALLADGRVVCWGPNLQGGVGAGARGGSALARSVTLLAGGTLNDARTLSLAPFLSQACAVRSDTSVLCWGGNERGEVQPNALGSVFAALGVRDARGNTLTGVRDVAVGASASCALLTSGGVVCWGANERGQLGRVTLAGASNFAEAVQTGDGAPLSGVEALYGNYGSFCATSGAGQLFCWGNNDQAQLGDGSVETRRYAVPVLGDVRALSLGASHGCAVRGPESALLCWGGSKRFGSAGSASGTTLYPQPVRDGAGDARTGVRGVAAGGQHSCLIDAALSVKCWGDDTYGQVL